MKGYSRLILISIILLVAGGYGFAQEVPQDAAFVAYRCEFQSETNQARIRAVLMGSDGLPIPRDNYTLSVMSENSGETLAAEKISATIVQTRPPLQVLLLLDATDTVPLDEVVESLREPLISQLQILDEIAIMKFGEEISPPTQFYTDKNRFVDDNLDEVTFIPGENRLYDAILEGVSELQFGSNMRKVIFVVTDSGRREEEQATLDRIIAESREADIQIFSIGYYTFDSPDPDELIAMANGTGGYAFITNEEENTRVAIKEFVADYTVDFIRTLNSEILVTVDMHGQEPDVNGRVVFDIVVDADNEVPLSDQVSCPITDLQHSIEFTGEYSNAPVAHEVEVTVDVQSDMNLDETTVVFWVNDEIEQNSSATSYLFDAPNLTPGYYTIGAQLRDRYNLILATAPTTITLYVQQKLELEVTEDIRPDETKFTRFEVTSNPEVPLGEVYFTMAASYNPRQAYPLGDGAVPFAPDGTAVLIVDDMAATIKEAFPELAVDDSVQIQAIVPSPNEGDYDLAASNKATFVPAPPPDPIPQEPINLKQYLPALILLFLVILNILLFRWVKRLRIRRIITIPDKHDLSPQLMTVTVKRDASVQSHTLTKKTVFVGRGASNDINIGDDANVSRQHGVIMWRRQGWYYSNRKGKVKTRIDGKLHQGYVFRKLEPVTELEIGHVILLFHSHTQRDISDFITTNI